MSGSERSIFDPDFCEHRCPICTRARKGNRIARSSSHRDARHLRRLSLGRARRKKYGVKPNEPLPTQERK